MGFVSLVGETNLDMLPLGPSKHKFSIAKIEKDQVVAAAANKAVTMADIIKENKKTDVFIFGESHTSYECHTFQRDFIEALYKEHPKIVVGFEFFLRDDNEALDAFVQGKLTEEELLKKVGWYKKTAYNYGYTRLIMEVIEKHKLKATGLNIARTLLRKVSRKGFAALSKEEKKLFPTIGIDNPEHEYFIKSVFGIFAVQVPMWFTNVYNAQKCWDVIMAESMRKVLSQPRYKGYKGIIIAGSNHVAYKLGIPFRYKKADRKVKLTTIVPVTLPEEKEDGEDEDANPMMKMLGKSLKPAAIFSRGLGDYVFSIPKDEHEHFPVLGIRTKLQDDNLLVTYVRKESIAEKSGIKKDDIITAVDGVEIKTKEQLHVLLAVKNWGDSINITVSKKVEIKKDPVEQEAD